MMIKSPNKTRNKGADKVYRDNWDKIFKKKEQEESKKDKEKEKPDKKDDSNEKTTD